MSIDKNAGQRRILTVRAEVLGSLRRDLRLLSVPRLVQTDFFVWLVAEEMLWGIQFEYL